MPRNRETNVVIFVPLSLYYSVNFHVRGRLRRQGREGDWGAAPITCPPDRVQSRGCGPLHPCCQGAASLASRLPLGVCQSSMGFLCTKKDNSTFPWLYTSEYL